MKCSKNIGLVSWIGTGNYGTALQAFALFSFLKKKGYHAYYVLEISSTNMFTLLVKEIISKTLRFLGFRRRRFIDSSLQGHTVKEVKMQKFVEEEIKYVSAMNFSKKRSVLYDTDVFCVGSDQVWNSYYSKDTFMLLPWAGRTKKISYASSIGTSDVAPDMREVYKNELMKFSHISLREKTGSEAITRLTGRNDIKTVLDPTFLLDKEEWMSVLVKAEIEIPIPEKFILCYLIGNNGNYHQQLQRVKEKYGIETMILLPAEECWDFYVDGAIRYEDAAIREFLYLLNKATLVLTDSFHATALCINMQKDFVEFLRYKTDNASSQNSRIYDVLQMFNLEDRLYDDKEDKWAKPIDFEEATTILESQRKRSVDYLLNAIEA